jgi:hypothetical protein
MWIAVVSQSLNEPPKLQLSALFTAATTTTTTHHSLLVHLNFQGLSCQRCEQSVRVCSGDVFLEMKLLEFCKADLCTI